MPFRYFSGASPVLLVYFSGASKQIRNPPTDVSPRDLPRVFPNSVDLLLGRLACVHPAVDPDPCFRVRCASVRLT